MQLRNSSAVALRGVHNSLSSSSCARSSFLRFSPSISSSPASSAAYSTSGLRSVSRSPVTTLRPALATLSGQSTAAKHSAPSLIQVRKMASDSSKIKVKNPVVELDGDEVCFFYLFLFDFHLFNLAPEFWQSCAAILGRRSICSCSIGKTRGRAAFAFKALISTANHCSSRCCSVDFSLDLSNVMQLTDD